MHTVFFHTYLHMSAIVKRLQFVILLTLALTPSAFADEGMWLPHLLRLLNESDMKAQGLRLSADDIYNINRVSLKDAVVQFGNGCTGEIISSNGLVLTNHHCGFGEIQYHSTLQNNYLRDGFWAKSTAEELPCPGLTVSMVNRIEDVSERVLAGISANTSEQDRGKIIDKNLATIRKEMENATGLKVIIRPFYYGAEYIAFVMEEYTDVRLVGAPPSGIGKFGGDTDNWVWPRHTGDFSLFRIYANRNSNKPAAYDAANLPFKPRFHFPINIGGVKEGDFTMVMGFPGRTQEYLSSYAIRIITEKVNAPKIAFRTQRLGLMDKYMKADQKVFIQYADKYAGVANAWKKWQGENNGITRLNGIGKKQEDEKAFLRWVTADQERFKKYGYCLENLKKEYDRLEPMNLAFDYWRECILSSEALSHANGWRSILAAPDSAKPKVAASIYKSLREYYKDHHDPLDRELFALSMATYVQDIPVKFHPAYFTSLRAKYKDDWSKMAEDLYNKTAFADSVKTKKLIDKSLKRNNWEAFKADPMVQLASAFSEVYEKDLLPVYRDISRNIDINNRLFLSGRREMQKDRKFYPDANFTLRVTYGKVASYEPKDGVIFTPFTTLDGVMAKNDPTVEEFQVPQKLQDLYRRRDFGIYAVNGTVPVAFIASNHTSGGNSGSPVLDAWGNLVGLNFDRCWEGTMSDLMYDKSRCRNIAMDARYLLFVIDKVGDCPHLIREMTLVVQRPEDNKPTPAKP